MRTGTSIGFTSRLRATRLARLTLYLTLAVSWLGCETSVDPIIGEERPYTIWGLFDAGADTQKVRVFTIEEFAGVSRPGEIDAEVISTNLTTRETRIWTHRRVTYEDGTVGHVFWSPFRAQHEHRYRLEVRRSDGAVSSATVTVPPEVEVEVEHNRFTLKAVAKVYGDVPNMIDVKVRYEGTNLPPVHAWPEGTRVHPPVFLAVDIRYADKREPILGGWKYEIDMVADFELVRDAFANACLLSPNAEGIALRRIEFRFVSADSSWMPPNGVFDPDILVEPGTMSNVNNGFGFFGAGQVVRERFLPDRATREKIGYQTDRPCETRASPSCSYPPVPCLNNVSSNDGPYYR